jgi:hypothetical protein
MSFFKKKNKPFGLKNDISSKANTIGLEEEKNASMIRIDCDFMVEDEQ